MTFCLPQTSFKQLSCEELQQQQRDLFPLKEQASSCMAIMQEQQHSLKQLVRIASLQHVYKNRIVFFFGSLEEVASTGLTLRYL